MLASDVIERLYYLDRENLLLNSTAKLSFAPVNPIVDAGQNDLLTNAMPMNMKITAVNIRHDLDMFNVVNLKRVYDDNGEEIGPNEPTSVNLMLKIPNAAEANNIQDTWTDWLNKNIEYDDDHPFRYSTRIEGAGGVYVKNGIVLTYGSHWGNFITPETGLIINNLTFDNININGGGRIPFSKKGKKNRSSQKKNRKTKQRTFKKSSQKKNRKLKRKKRRKNKKKSRRIRK